MINIRPERAYFIGIYKIPIKFKVPISTLVLKRKKSLLLRKLF